MLNCVCVGYYTVNDQADFKDIGTLYNVSKKFNIGQFRNQCLA